MSISIIHKSPYAIKLHFSEDKMIILLEDGRELAVPLEWFPKLRDASQKALLNWRLVGNGEGIHWQDLDEDILVKNLLI